MAGVSVVPCRRRTQARIGPKLCRRARGLGSPLPTSPPQLGSPVPIPAPGSQGQPSVRRPLQLATKLVIKNAGLRPSLSLITPQNIAPTSLAPESIGVAPRRHVQSRASHVFARRRTSRRTSPRPTALGPPVARLLVILAIRGQPRRRQPELLRVPHCVLSSGMRNVITVKSAMSAAATSRFETLVA